MIHQTKSPRVTASSTKTAVPELGSAKTTCSLPFESSSLGTSAASIQDKTVREPRQLAPSTKRAQLGMSPDKHAHPFFSSTRRTPFFYFFFTPRPRSIKQDPSNKISAQYPHHTEAGAAVAKSPSILSPEAVDTYCPCPSLASESHSSGFPASTTTNQNPCYNDVAYSLSPVGFADS